MKKRFIQFIAGSLALLLLAGCGGKAPVSVAPAAKTPVTESVPAATMAPSEPIGETETVSISHDPLPAGEEIPRSDGINADVDFADMAWYLYDMTDFNASAERLSSTEDEAEAQELYDWLLTEYRRLSTLDELAWIDFYAYGTEADEEACQTTDEMLREAGDTLYAAISDALTGDVAGEFSSFVGEDVSDALIDYEEMTDREMELLNRETELQLAYNNLIVREDLSEPEINYQAGEILLELVSIRNELAEIYGYDTFADYAYEAYYGRDYTPADAAALCEELKPIAKRYFENC